MQDSVIIRGMCPYANTLNFIFSLLIDFIFLRLSSTDKLRFEIPLSEKKSALSEFVTLRVKSPYISWVSLNFSTVPTLPAKTFVIFLFSFKNFSSSSKDFSSGSLSHISPTFSISPYFFLYSEITFLFANTVTSFINSRTHLSCCAVFTVT